MSGSAGLRRFVPGAPGEAPEAQPAQPAEAARSAPEEACEFCATVISADHGHVADLDSSTLMCACRACYLLFTHSGAGQGWRAGPGEGAGQGSEEGTGQERRAGPEEAAGGRPGPEQGAGQERRAGPGQERRIGRARYRSIPDRYRSDPGHPLTVAEWNALEIPVGLAFFLRSSASGDTTAFYPSPAGATECRLDLDAWGRIVAEHPLVAAAAPDVEAVLVSRGPLDQDGVDAFLVPIDACYELAGRMRLLWRGFDGGAEARQSVAEFLDRVRARSQDLGQER
ncbi:MAG TPA: DUF5947 family protein [Streptosporangiaceae bacterium]|nr:DUF5947 family protein [Streptosporangiaceae bacterium]